MKITEPVYCLKAESERYSEVCEECISYGKVGCDHCFNDNIDIAIEALEAIQKVKELRDYIVHEIEINKVIIEDNQNLGDIRDNEVGMHIAYKNVLDKLNKIKIIDKIA